MRLHHYLHGSDAAGAEGLGNDVVATARLGAFPQHLDPQGAGAHARGRHSQRHQGSQPQRDKEGRTLHDPQRPAVPEASPPQPAHQPREAPRLLDPIAEVDEQGGQQAEGGQHRDQDGHDPSHGHRAENGACGHKQGREGDDDRQAAEGDSLAGVGHRRYRRCLRVSAQAAFVAEAADGEERVVNAHAQPDHAGDVLDEDGDRHKVAEEEGAGQGERNGQQPHEKGQTRRHQCPKDEDQHHQRHREADGLRPQQALLTDVQHLGVDRLLAGDIGGQPGGLGGALYRLHELVGVVEGLLAATGAQVQVGVGGVAVRRHQGAVAVLEEAVGAQDHPRRAGSVEEGAGSLGVAGVIDGDVVAVESQELGEGAFTAELVGDDAQGLRRVAGAAGHLLAPEHFLDTRSEREAQYKEHRPDGQHQPSAGHHPDAKGFKCRVHVACRGAGPPFKIRWRRPSG